MVEIIPPDSNETIHGSHATPEQEATHTEPHPSEEGEFDSQAITEEAVAENSQPLGLAPPTTSGFSEENEASFASPLSPESETISWESDETRRKRQIGLIVAVSAVSLLICLVGFGWFVSSWQTDQQASQDNQESEINRSQSISSGEDAPDVAEPSASNLSEQEQANDQFPPNVDSTFLPENTSSSEEPQDQKPATEITPPPDQEPPATDPPMDLIPVSPLNEPPTPAANNQQGNFEEPAEQDGLGGMQELPPGLQQYTQFLLEEGAIEQPNLDAPPSMDDLEIDEATRELDRPIAPLRPKDLDFESALSIKLAVDTEGYAFPELVLLISQVTSVPIQIDWVSFDLGGIDLTTPCELTQGWKTAKDILQDACKTIGAELRNEDSLMTVTLSDQKFSEIHQEITDLEEFGSSNQATLRLLSSLLNLENQDGTLGFADGNREEQQLSAIVVEALRSIRGKTQRVNNQSLSRWIWDPEGPALGWTTPIQGRSFPQSDVPMTVAEFIRRLSEENGVQVLINWQDLLIRGVNPELVFLPHSAATSAEMASGAFASLGLEVRQVDATHWWIGQRSTYDRLPVVTWTQPLAGEPEVVTERLKSLLQEIVGADTYRLELDQETRRALVVLPRYLAIQLPKLIEGLSGTDIQEIQP